MSDERKFCRTCNWSMTGNDGRLSICTRKVVIDLVEGPRIAYLSTHFQRSIFGSIFGGCGIRGKYWERLTFRERGDLDKRLL